MMPEPKAITASFHLIVSSKGKVRVTKGKPALEFDEVAILLGVQLPEALFKRPLIRANVIVDSSAVPVATITPDVVLSTAQLIEQATGMRVELKVIPPEEGS